MVRKVSDKASTNLTRQIATALVRHDRLFFLLGILLLVGLGVGLPKLTFSTDNREFFGADNPDLIALEQVEDVFARSDTLIFAIAGDDDLCTPQALTHLRDFTQEAWLLPDVLRVESVANFNHSYAEADDIIVEALLPEDGEINAAVAARLREIALGSDELVNRLIAPDCRALGIFVSLAPSEHAERKRSEMAQIARATKAAWQERMPQARVHVSGGVIGGVSINEAAQRDLLQLVPVAFVFVSILMFLGLGTLSGWLATLLVTIGGTIATMGFAGMIGISLIPATAISPLAVMVLITATCVHVILGWTRRMAVTPDRMAATQGTLEENLAAVTVTNLTTAIGFLCLNFAESPPLAQMGTIVSFGILVGWVLNGLFLPLILRRAPDFRFDPVRIPASWLAGIASFALRQRGILTLFAMASIICVGGLTQIRFNDSPLRYFDESFSFRTDSDAIEEALTGMEGVQFVLRSGADESVFAPAFLARVDHFADWVHTQDKVVFVGSVTDVIKRLNQTLYGGGPLAYKIAETREANAQAMMLYELSLPVGQDMNQMLDIDRTQTRLGVVLRHADGQDIAQFAAASEAWLRKNEPLIATQAVGVGVAFSRLTQRNNKAMLYGMLTVMVLVSGLMIVTLRSVPLGMVSLVPNVLPAVLAFGLWGWLIGDVNLGSTVVTTMTFGIVVDDTVHILMHYQRRRRAGMAQEDALRETFRTVGTALMVTSIAICSGFIVMTQSGFAINQHLGGLTAVVIVLALITDLILLPALLKRTKL